jgi:predicted CoA-binding protein
MTRGVGGTSGDGSDVLATADTVLVVDWPTRDVPESLARAGLRVFVHGGPGPGQYTEYEMVGGEVATRPAGGEPERADLVYSYRPVAELPGIVELAQRVGAATVWVHAADDDEAGRGIVESAGLRCVTSPSIVEAARRRRRPE